MPESPLPAALETIRTSTGESLLELSNQQPRLVVFLRHSGCTFCREALNDLRAQRAQIEAAGVGIVLVHQTTDEAAAAFFKPYGLDDVPRIADPELALFGVFDLRREKVRNMFRPTVWWRGMQSALFHRHGFGRIKGDVRQMPGVFLLDQGKITAAFRHDLPSDRPDYAGLACPR